MTWVSTVLFIVLFGLSCYGWGRFVGARTAPRLLTFSSLTILLGLAAVTWIGGLLNWVGAARPLGLLAVLGVGAAITVGVGWERWRSYNAWRKARAPRPAHAWGPRAARWLGRHGLLLAPWLIAGALAFALVPCTLFNLYDDFHTYLVRPLRMLETGRLAGSPFDPLGLDSLGAQSCLQAFFVANGNLRTIHAFDAVFCLGLCLMLLGEAALRWRVPKLVAVLAQLALTCINPQAVNVSSLYSGTATLLGAALMLRILGPRILAAGGRRDALLPLIPLAFVVSMGAVLKVTVLLGLASLGGAVWILLLVHHRGRWSAWRPGLVLLALVSFLVLPWVLGVLPPILAARAAADALPLPSLPAATTSLLANGVAGFLSTGRLYYGNTLTDYHVLLAFCAGVGLLGAWGLRGRRRAGKPGVDALLAVALAAAALVTTFASLFLFGLMTGVRYACPLLVAAFALLTLLGARFQGLPTHAPHWRPEWRIILLAQLVVVALFAQTTVRRFRLAFAKGTLLSYAFNDADERYSREAFGLGEGLIARQLQQRIEPGATALAWTMVPFRFDFARNPVWNLSEPGLINPALRFPVGASSADLRLYFRALGVRYLILEKPGSNRPVKSPLDLQGLLTKPSAIDRKLAAYAIYARAAIEAMLRDRRILYEGERFVVGDLQTTRPPGGESASPPEPTTARAHGPLH